MKVTMKLGRALCLIAWVVAMDTEGAVAQQHRVIFDTDFAVPPQDDGMALILALHSPEIEILGITTVAGNYSMEHATSDALRVLEIARRTDIPVYRGANMPLVHEKSDYAERVWGEWWSDEPPPPPPGGFAMKQAEAIGAAEFIVQTVKAQPGEITIVAIGPLTNIAMAIRQSPDVAANVKQIVIMGRSRRSAFLRPLRRRLACAHRRAVAEPARRTQSAWCKYDHRASGSDDQSAPPYSLVPMAGGHRSS